MTFLGPRVQTADAQQILAVEGILTIAAELTVLRINHGPTWIIDARTGIRVIP